MRNAAHLVISFAGRLDADRLHRAVRLSLDAEPILGCRFVEHWFRPYWQRYEDLDRLPWFQIHETENPEDTLKRLLADPLTHPVQVLLLRAKTDRVCIKMMSRIGDGGALMHLGCLLADVYTRLQDDPRYRPMPSTDYDRSIRPISSRFSVPQRFKLLREGIEARRRMGPPGYWTFPPTDAAGVPDDFVIRRVSAERVSRIAGFAYQRRATAFQVLVAAFFQALCESVPHSSDRPFRVLCPVDLRPYLRGTSTRPLCNLTGVEILALDPGPAPRLDDLLAQIRDQLYGRWKSKTLGLPFSAVAVDLPVLKQLMDLLPYAYAKRKARADAELQRSRQGNAKRAIVVTNGGIPGDRLRFADVRAVDAFGTSSVQDAFGMVVTTFEGSMTVSIGCGPTAVVHEIAERMLQRLPD